MAEQLPAATQHLGARKGSWESPDEASNWTSQLALLTSSQYSLLYIYSIFDSPHPFSSSSVLALHRVFSLCPYSFMFSFPKEQSLAWFAKSLSFDLQRAEHVLSYLQHAFTISFFFLPFIEIPSPDTIFSLKAPSHLCSLPLFSSTSIIINNPIAFLPFFLSISIITTMLDTKCY